MIFALSSKQNNMDKNKLENIKVLLMDMDGCLTNGFIIHSSSGDDLKMFHTHDGYGITRGRQLGLIFAIISGMKSAVNKRRVERLKIHHLFEDIDDKRIPFEELKNLYNFKNENFAYIGDDSFDIPLLKEVGFSACPNNAMEDVKENVNYICRKNGGEGAVREVIDLILKSQNLI